MISHDTSINISKSPGNGKPKYFKALYKSFKINCVSALYVLGFNALNVPCVQYRKCIKLSSYSENIHSLECLIHLRSEVWFRCLFSLKNCDQFLLIFIQSMFLKAKFLIIKNRLSIAKQIDYYYFAIFFIQLRARIYQIFLTPSSSSSRTVIMLKKYRTFQKDFVLKTQFGGYHRVPKMQFFLIYRKDFSKFT